MTRAFRSADTRGVLAQIALWGYAGFAALSGVLSGLGVLGLHDDYVMISAITGFEVLGLPVAATLFCVWFYRVYANLQPLGRPETAFALWWAPACFFVPIVNSLHPYEVAKECWIHSDPPPTELPAGVDPAEYHFSARLPVAWWLCCLAWFVVSMLHFMTQVMTIRGFSVHFAFSLVADCLTVAAAICGVRMIREINRRQRKRYQMLTSKGSLGGAWKPT